MNSLTVEIHYKAGRGYIMLLSQEGTEGVSAFVREIKNGGPMWRQVTDGDFIETEVDGQVLMDVINASYRPVGENHETIESLFAVHHPQWGVMMDWSIQTFSGTEKWAESIAAM
jgi:hypothetical protein